MVEKSKISFFAELTNGCESISRFINESLCPIFYPKLLINNHVQLSANKLIINDEMVNLSDYSEIMVLGIGKAAIPMGLAIKQILGKYFSGGLLATHSDYPITDEIRGSGYSIIYGSHPIPDQLSVTAAEAIIDYLKKVNEFSLLIVLVSGGGSAIVSHPRGDITIQDLQELNKILIESGASIKEINAVRKHCDDLKGGGLLKLAYPGKVVSLILSDVIGNNLDTIASGMTTPDTTTFQEAIDILWKYNLFSKTPKRIRSFLMEGSQGINYETIKAGDPGLAPVSNYIIADIVDAMHGVKEVLSGYGIKTKLEFPLFEGDTTILANEILGNILLLQTNKDINALIFGGESTVSVTGSGLGGRNQDLALKLVPLISGMMNIGVITLATDGRDGPTDAAGAIITGLTEERAIGMGLDINCFISDNNSYGFFDALGDNIKIGATGTNLNDLVIVFKTD